MIQQQNVQAVAQEILDDSRNRLKGSKHSE
jgi:hypothetical protein